MASFRTTQWSVILRVRDAPPEVRRQALAHLCEAYWPPVHTFIRRSVRDVDRAEDLTQGFFLHLLEEGALAGLDPRCGRFRSYLLGAVRHYLADARDRGAALKRGGGAPTLSFDSVGTDSYRSFEPVDTLTPEQSFESHWARAVLARAMLRLERQMTDRRKAEEFRHLRPLLTGDDGAAPYREIADRVGSTEGAIKVAVHRLRRRFGECLRDEIGETVDDPEDVEREIRHLMAALS